MSESSRSRTIAAAPEAIWAVLADFGGLSSWVANVDHSCVLVAAPDGASIGTARRVQVGRNTLVETITAFTAPTELAYEIAGLPTRLGRLTNRWTLAPTATGGTAVTVTSSAAIGASAPARLTERVVSRLLAQPSGAMLAGLATRLERTRD